jgi:hypothetical protein
MQMTILSSSFDVIGRDPHPNARAGLLVVIGVNNPSNPYSSLPSEGTPVAGTIFRGAVVIMNTSGKAILADNASTSAFVMPFVTIDGDQDYDGAFVHKITCIQGGAEFLLDSTGFVAGSYLPSSLLTWGSTGDAGKFTAATTTKQIYGMVGDKGYDSVKSTLHVIVPQGISPKQA